MSPRPHMIKQDDRILHLVHEHIALRTSGASAIDLGLFYRRGLDDGEWSNQADIARSLGISKGYVSKAVRAAGLPDEIVAAVGGRERVSFRVAEALEKVIRIVGLDVARLRASVIGDGQGLRTDDVISSIASGRPPACVGPAVTITVSRTGKFMKVESPHMERLIANLPKIEAFLSMFT
ncbi:hypothetical protein WJ47_12915 [Burkholderia ubonensis]|uniref:Uncharacterized protein n=2 Tax=Burkholderia ubonensis TaxID=101571 RepID=A0AB73FSV4_9BURK|nr:hypothetical protein WJ44_33395 [Burkholderia ubonensis]KVL66246.1 hypothetical protein WJ47_12915 [Burkholderia ubonensis]KVM19978.1 hypothetical protein WJ53_22980 [Burkholderia ubonensis]KVM26865.1 hypothetical protein WJ54_16600 [Burkholderia ubonensis]